MIGRVVSVEELLVELIKDRAFYKSSTSTRGNFYAGGVTLSGGEPTFQPEFAEAILCRLKEQEISTAIDTCGLTSPHSLGRLLPFIDLVMFDLKLYDPLLHREFTGVSNKQVLENLEFIRDFRRTQSQPLELWIRTPLIPGVTTTEDNLSALSRYLAESMEGSISRWELCAFNNLCRDQYSRLGTDWAFSNTPLMTGEELGECERIAKAAGIRSDLIVATGATRTTQSL